MGKSKRNYDVIIVGASFAGLAVASKIKTGRVLLIDAKPIGEGVKSACGTLRETFSRLGFADCILQAHNKMVIHTALSDFTYHLKSPFCVIDGDKFCHRLFEAGKTEFVRAKVLGFDGKAVKTTKGSFRAEIFVDASGPNSVLGKSKSRYLSSGLETIVDYKEKGLHLWYEPKIFPKGVFWLFPQGKTSRAGVASYVGERNLLPELSGFLKRFKLKPKSLHGGYFPYRIRDPVLGRVFLVGDAAGQCFPITGEGIRPSLFFGQKLGEIINLILDKKVTHQEGLELYGDFVLKGRKYKYELMYLGQKFITNVPQTLVSAGVFLASKRLIADFFLDKYLNILDSEQNSVSNF
ncbi:MAG: hypothetical protein ACC618_00795 [Patescibacteria group bacterium]